MKKYLYLLAGLAAGFVLVFMGTAICQYLHLTQSGYVRYDDSVEVVYQQVAEYAGVDPATLSIHAKRQVGDDIFVLWKTPDRTEVSMTQLRQASFGGHTYLCPEAGLLARTDDDPARRYGRSPAIDKMLTTKNRTICTHRAAPSTAASRPATAPSTNQMETSPTVTASTMPKTTMAAIQMTIIAPPFGFPLGF